MFYLLICLTDAFGFHLSQEEKIRIPFAAGAKKLKKTKSRPFRHGRNRRGRESSRAGGLELSLQAAETRDLLLVAPFWGI